MLEVLARSQHPHAAEEVCLVYVIIVCSVVLSMYVCTYIYLNISISIYFCRCIYAYICIFIYVYMYVYVYVYICSRCWRTLTCQKGVFDIRYDCVLCCTLYIHIFTYVYIYMCIYIHTI